ncbi:kinase rad3 protein [Rutstroemia sp. NJR-2017a WRK4]|nr:kinase rad3 protein [Rutstroemia sp. NJR-2017a WRK4]
MFIPIHTLCSFIILIIICIYKALTNTKPERAVSGRATCNNKECKDAGVKIGKDELRLGTWVETKDHASWHWRHWGCVTGKQLENLRLYLEGEDNHGSGEYRWDFLDGYDDSGKGGLDGHPDLKAKVRRVVEQGFIDPEDWNGDPEMNRLGEKGTRTAENKKQLQADKSAGMGSMEELQASLEEAKQDREQFALDGQQNTMVARANDKKIIMYEKELKNRLKRIERERNAAEKQQEKERLTAEKQQEKENKKRGRAKKEEDIDEEEAKPAKKKRVTKPKIEDSEEEAEVIPAKTSRARKTAVKKEEPEEVDVKPARGRKAAVKKEESPDLMLDELQVEEQEEVKPVRKGRAKKGAVKKEEDGDDEVLTKAVPARKGGRKKAVVVKEEESEVEEMVEEEEEIEEEEESEEEKPKAKKGKKGAAAGGKRGRKAKA